jgi:hypothetical protein
VGERGVCILSLAALTEGLSVTSERVREALSELVRERDWAQFHTPANLSKSISIEAGELLECFQWSDDADEVRVREELADVFTLRFRSTRVRSRNDRERWS